MTDSDTNSDNLSDIDEQQEIEIEQNLNRPIALQLRRPILGNLNNLNNANMVDQAAILPGGFHVSLLGEISYFNGQTAALSEFIRSFELLNDQFSQPNDPNAYINKLLLNAARNRLKDQALEVVAGQNIGTWLDLKNILIENFADQRSELNLNADLIRLRQMQKESPIDFYNRCISMLAILNSKISLTNDAIEVKNYRIAQAKQTALKTFITGLAEPMGSFVRSRNPVTLENALTIVKEEIDIRYFRNSQNSFQQINKVTQKQMSPNYQNFEQRFKPKYQNNSQQWFQPPNRNYQPFKYPTGYVQQSNNFPQQRFQQNFTPRYLNPNTPPRQFPGQRPFGKPGQNVFAPRQNFVPTKAEPMEFSTIKKRPASQQIGNVRQRPFNPNFGQRPNFTTGQLHQTNFNPEYQTDELDEFIEYEQEYEPEEYQTNTDDYQYPFEEENESDINFQISASESDINFHIPTSE